MSQSPSDESYSGAAITVGGAALPLSATGGAASAPSEPAPTVEQSGLGRGIAMAALLIMVGTLSSRVLGLVRESVINGRFGITPDITLFRLLSVVPTQLYDFLVGGLVSAALVPVLSDYADADDHQDLWRVISTILTILLSVLGVFVGLVWIFAPQIARVLAPNLVSDPARALLGQALLRTMVGAVVLMGVSGLLTGLLQAQRRFLLPAFTTSVFNVGMIGVIVLSPSRNVQLLAWGMLAGAVAQVLLQAPGLRGSRLRPALNLRHPGVRRIGVLYAPVALGISFSLVGSTIDRKLADAVGGNAAAYMFNATMLVQFTLGLVAAAISLAILPTLARLNTSNDEAGFRRVLGVGLQTVVMLIVPALVLLALQGESVIRLLFERGQFTPANTRFTALVLLAYLPSLLAAAVDQPLIFAFYARKHTLLPNAVQGLAVGTYIVVALALYQRWGIYGLVAGNVAQWSIHALVMIGLAHQRLRVFDGQRLVAAFGKIALAGGVMAASCWAVGQMLPHTASHRNALLTLGIAGGVSSGVYFAALWWLRLEALNFFTRTIVRRFNRAG